MSVNLAAIKGKVTILIRGGLTSGKSVVTTNGEKSADAIVAGNREGQNQTRWRSMQSTTDDKRKHSQLTIWDYLRKDNAEQEDEAGVCLSLRMDETDTTNKPEQKAKL